MAKSFVIIIFFAFLQLSPSAFGAPMDSIDALDGLVRNQQSITTGLTTEETHWYSHPMMIGGLKSSNSLGRVSTFGNSLRSREEIFLGVRTPSGWGVSVMESTTFKTTNRSPSDSGSGGSVGSQSRHNRKKSLNQQTIDGGLPPSPVDTEGDGGLSDRNGIGDPSIAITHPVHDWGSVRLSGMFRQSFPVSDYSVQNHNWVTGYYSVLSVRMPARYRFSTSLTFNYVTKDNYVAPNQDTNFSTGLMASLSRHFSKWFRAGVGERNRVDFHQYGPVGQSAELFTSCDFMLSPTLFAGPRIHFPIYSVNSFSLDGTPSSPSIGNISAEFYLQAAL